MAHPLPVGISVKSGMGITRNRPDLAALIGRICSDWAFVENSLSQFYAHLMGIYLDSPPGYEPPSHPVAHQIFDEIKTIHSRIQLVKRLVDWVIKDEQQKNDRLDVLDQLRKAGKGRNKVAHGVWGICESEPDALILLPSFGHKSIYKKSDFELIIEQINAAKKELGRVHHKFYQSLKNRQS